MGKLVDIFIAYLLLANVSRGKLTRTGKECDCHRLREAKPRGLRVGDSDKSICLQLCRENIRQRNNLAENQVELKSDTGVQDTKKAEHCVDVKTGKRHVFGSQWRRRCNVYKCHNVGSISSHKLECPKHCVSEKDDRSACCHICKRKVLCSPKNIIVVIPKPMLRGNDLDKLYLSDLKCRPTFNNTHVIFRSNLTNCGTKVKKTKLGLRFSNKVVRSYFGIIVRPWFKFSCYFKVKKTDVDSPNAGQFKVRRVDENISIKMAYTDKNGNFLAGNPMNAETVEGTPVHVSIAADQMLTNGRFIVVEKCELVSLNRLKNYDLIRQGCPTEPTLRILERKPNKVWFSFQAKILARTNSQYKDWFSYQGKRFYPKDKEYVDLTCQAAICSGKSSSIICNRFCTT